jgi:hypothetical protein
MSKQIVNIGSAPNDGTGDSIRVGMNKINLNFNEIYSAIGNGTNVSDIQISNASASGNGSIGYANRTLTFTPPDLSGYLTSVQASNLNSISINALSDVDTVSSAPSNGQALVWSTNKWVPQTISSGGGSGIGISYSDLSVSYSAASGVGTLTYNNTNGTFTFAPADFSGYLTGIGTISGHTDVQVSNPQVGEVLKWDGVNWVNGTDSTGTGGGGGIAGVTVLDSGSSVGTSATFDFGSNLTATLSSGTVTINATDTNTTYSQSAVSSGSNVNLRLSGSDSVNDDILVTAGTNISISNVTAAGFTVNSSAYSRTTGNATTASIGVGQAADLAISAAKTYVLYSVQTNYPAWVTLYVDTASRTADASRLENTDPLPGSGVIAEVITTSGNLTQLITPGTIGFNNDGTPSANVYAKVVNKDSQSRAIQVTLKYLKLED